MKKLTCCILVLMLCITRLCALAQESLVDEFFRCQAGMISFVLPGYPQIIHEEDLPARELENTYMAWKDKFQLMGSGAMGGEYQVHIADLAPSIEWMREDRPGEEEIQYQLNALMSMITFYLSIHSGNVTDDVQPLRARSGDRYFAELNFGYTYPDAPGVEYRGRAFMDGSLAVVMMVQVDEVNLAVLENMRPLTAEKAAAFLQEDPHTVAAGRLQVTFPEEPLATLEEGYWLYEAFTQDYGYVSLEHMQADLRFMLANGMDEDSLLQALTESTAQSMQTDGIISDYEVRKLAEGMYAFEAMEVDPMYPEDHAPVGVRVLSVFTLDGVYTVNAVDTDIGRAIFESLIILDAAE